MHAIETARLRLQPLDSEHEGLYCRIYTDPALMRHVAAPLSEDQARRSFQVACRQSTSTHPAWWWAIHPNVSGEAIGVAGLTGGDDGLVEIGAMLLADAQGRGIVTETFSALLNVAFSTLQVAGIRARHAPGNAAMATVLRKLGFRPEHTNAAAPGDWSIWRLDAPAQDRGPT